MAGSRPLSGPISLQVHNVFNLVYLSVLASMESLFGCRQGKFGRTIDHTESIAIVQLTEHSFVHRTNLLLQNGRFFCNGLIYVDHGKAVIFDAPSTNAAVARV